MTNKQINEKLDTIMSTLTSMDTRIKALEESKTVSPKKGTPKKTESSKETEKVAFTRRDGKVVYGTPAQVAQWTKWQEGSKEYEATKKEVTKAGRAYVKAHPGCTRKEAAANGCPHITKDELKALKVELGVR